MSLIRKKKNFDSVEGSQFTPKQLGLGKLKFKSNDENPDALSAFSFQREKIALKQLG